MPAVLAMVNGKPLTAESFREATNEGFARQIFETLLHRRLIWDEAQRLGITLSKSEFEAKLHQVKAGYGSPEAFQTALHQQGLTEAYFDQRLKTQMLLDMIVDRRGALREDEISAYYDKHKSEYVRPARVHLFDLVTTDAEAAYAARRRISNGEEFAAVAKEMSVDPSAAQGGDRGWLSATQVPDELMRATAFSLEVGQTSNPLLVSGKYHVLYVSEAEPGVSRNLAQARPDLITALRQEKGLTREAVQDALVREAGVQINWDPLRYLAAEYLSMKQIHIYVDGKPVVLPRPAFLVGGRLLAPAKPLVVALGARMIWTPGTSTLTAERQGKKVSFTSGKPIAMINGKARQVVASRIEGEILLVEPRALVEGLGGSVQWNAARNSLYIKSTPES
jgi:foldase protein PrsA